MARSGGLAVLLAASAIVTGCGRIGYDAVPRDAGGGGGIDASTPMPDAAGTSFDAAPPSPDAGAPSLDGDTPLPDGGDGGTSIVSDGSAVISDGASTTVDGTIVGCGDGTCDLSAGEYCNACPADCATATPVCGNGICDGTDTGTTCFDDCGPTVWPAASGMIESDILDMVNAHRAAGTACPGDSGPPRAPVPALIRVTDLEALARNLAWDYFHRAYSGERCAGVHIFDLIRAAGHDGGRGAGHSHVIPPSTTTAVDFYMADPDLCAALMDARYVVAGTGFVGDASDAWYVITFADR